MGVDPSLCVLWQARYPDHWSNTTPHRSSHWPNTTSHMHSSHTAHLTQHLTYTLISHHSSQTIISHHSYHTTHLTPLISHYPSHITHFTPIVSRHLFHTTALTPLLMSHQSSHTTPLRPLISPTYLTPLISHHTCLTTHLKSSHTPPFNHHLSHTKFILSWKTQNFTCGVFRSFYSFISRVLMPWGFSQTPGEPVPHSTLPLASSQQLGPRH